MKSLNAVCIHKRKFLPKGDNNVKKLKYKLAGALIGALKRIKPRRIHVTAVILAAGSGARMGSDVTKQWILLGNEPLFVHSLRSFENCRAIKEIILCVKAEEYAMYTGVAEKYGISKLKATVVGGKTRADSALAGFKMISDKTTHVAIHDAARCLVTPKMIRSVVSEAITYGSAAAACKATDTVKICNENGVVLNTPKRSGVWQVQTPQVFETEIYRASAYLALADKIAVTDDCSLAEHAGFKVHMVDCGKENIKITEPIDLYFASAILKKRRNEANK